MSLNKIIKPTINKIDRKAECPARPKQIQALRRHLGSGVHSNVKLGQGFPMKAGICCWNCCHKFDNPPVGIPEWITPKGISLYGNFCSYPCAKRYLLGATTEFLMFPVSDGEMELLEHLYHLETDAPLTETIKPAPPRLCLEMFGGDLSIAQYRQGDTKYTRNIYKLPMVPPVYLEGRTKIDKSHKP